MPELTLSFSADATEAVEALERLKINAIDLLRPPIQRGAFAAEGILKHYPPARSPGWHRSGDLGRSWTTSLEVTAAQVKADIGNIRKYAPFVQSADRQRPYHRATGWVTDRRALEMVAPQIVAEAEQALVRALS